MNKLIGRHNERIKIKNLLFSSKSEFLILYGRRRVGKTFLIKKMFAKYPYFFHFTGKKDEPTKEALSRFGESLSKFFNLTFKYNESISSWKKAFELLKDQIRLSQTKKFVIFIDETPWLDSYGSRIIDEIDHFWNDFCSMDAKVLLILCGSAASWIMDNIINNKGGLHNRMTARIILKPFNLKEAKFFMEEKKLHKTNKEILDLYLAIGGVPLYLHQIQKSLSVAHNIDEIYFQENGLLYDEFSKLYASLFKNSQKYIQILDYISQHHYGRNLIQITQGLKISSGGRLVKRLNELVACGFLARFNIIGKKEKGHYFKVIDEFTNFYFYWLKNRINPLILTNTQGEWNKIIDTPKWQTWIGMAFENCCFKHIPEIKKAIGLGALLI